MKKITLKSVMAVLVSLFSLNANAYDVEIDGIYYNLYNMGATVTYKELYEGTYTGNISIPQSIKYNGKDYPVKNIGERAFYRCSELTSVTIPNSVTSIQDEAFSGCSSLNSVTIPNSVTSIGAGAFGAVPWFNNQPDGLVYVGNVAYKYKGTMPTNTSIAIKEGTISISPNAFAYRSDLTSVTIPSSVTSIGNNAFYECGGLTSVTIPSSVTSIGNGTFRGCSGLTSVTIPSSVTSIGLEAFYQCRSLNSVTIPNSVTSIGESAFRGCSSLTSITIPNSITVIKDYTFDDCTNLVSVTIPNSVTNIGRSAFTYTVNMEHFYCHTENPPSVSSKTFSESYIKFATLYVPKASVSAYKKKSVWNKFGNIVALTDEESAIKTLTSNEDKSTKEVYTLDGRPASTLQKGVNILRMKDGKTKKVFVK